jgi:hypothetical protein
LPMAILSIIKAVIRARSRGLDTRVSIRNGILRTFLTYLQPRQLQYIMPAGNLAFQRWVATRKNLAEKLSKSDINPPKNEDAELFWIGDRDLGSTVILFFHGKFGPC